MARLAATFPPKEHVDAAVLDVALYRLAEKFGAQALEWSFDRIQSMLLLMDVDAEVQAENAKRRAPSPPPRGR